MSAFPAPQEKPARRLNYREKVRAGLVERKPLARIAPIAQKRVKKRREYAAWVKVAMAGQKCAFPGCVARDLEPHHIGGRHGDNLFKVIPCCSAHHRWIHEHPDAAFELGYLTPAYRGFAPNPSHPQPFTLLPYP